MEAASSAPVLGAARARHLSRDLPAQRGPAKSPGATAAPPVAAGSDGLTRAATEGIHAITTLGHAILLAESNIHHVPDFADRLYVIERGEIIFAGKPAEVHRHAHALRIIGGAA